jgi:hypothetical protein
MFKTLTTLAFFLSMVTAAAAESPDAAGAEPKPEAALTEAPAANADAASAGSTRKARSEARDARMEAREAKKEARREAKEEREPSDRNFLFSGSGTGLSHSGYGGPHMKFSRIAGSDAVLVGGRGAWLVGNFGLGGAGYGVVNEVAVEGLGDVALGYGGPFIEAIVSPDSLVNLSAALMLGFGGVTYGEGASRQWQSLVILEPDVHAQLNINTFMQLAAGVSYRWAASGNTDELSVNNAAVSVLLKFGWFR